MRRVGKIGLLSLRGNSCRPNVCCHVRPNRRKHRPVYGKACRQQNSGLSDFRPPLTLKVGTVLRYHKCQPCRQISFGLDPGGEYDQGQAALLAKHPDYPALVGQFVQADPGRRGRARLDLYRLARHFRGRAVLFVTHSWGGGIQRHINDMVAQLKAEGTSVVLLQIDRDHNLQVNVAYRGTEALYLPNLGGLYLPRDANVLAGFVAQLAPALIHVHSLAGLRWAAARALMDLVAGAGAGRPYAWTLHDYSPVCHRNHLVQPGGRFCGLAPVSECRACLAADADGFEEPDPSGRRSGSSWRGRRGCWRLPPTRRRGSGGCIRSWRSRCGRIWSQSAWCATPPCSGPATSGGSRC